MLRTLIAYVATGLSFAVIDAVWLTLMAPRLYRPALGDLLASEFRLGPAIVFYLLYIAGIIFFAVGPALADGRWQTALVRGAALGFLCYMTYDLTNQATLRTWATHITVLDIIWGTFLTGGAALAGFAITKMLVR